MSKIAQYLNEHLLGSVTGLASQRANFASDSSILEVTPELVVYPKATSDVRKAARFSWQLAEKGHVLSMTARGLGQDTTGGAIGPGLLIDMSKYLQSVIYVSPAKDKNKVLHAQAGATLRTLHEALKWHGLTVSAYSSDMPDMTIGGAIAGGVVTYRSGKYGTIADAVDRMEVVLANGDLMEVGRVNKREVNRKQGEQTLEGEIYRQIDGLIEENSELISKLSSEYDSIGYRIDQVKNKDGSIDLTPLFIGSQGTLGIISEVALKLGFYSDEESAIAVPCVSYDDARDVADILRQFDPASLLMIDNEYFVAARTRGKKFVFSDDDKDDVAVVYASFDDFSDKARDRKLKKVLKALAKRDTLMYSTQDHRLDELEAIRDVEQAIETPLRADETYVAICDGAHIPAERLREFMAEVVTLAETNSVKLPLKVDMLTGVVGTKTTLSLKKVSDKQKAFKLASGYADLVYKYDGSSAGGQAEGRLGAFAAYPQIDKDILELNEKIRYIFDPYKTLNPGVKQQADVKSLAKLLKSA